LFLNFALARLQRKFRLLESPYRTPQTLVGGPRGDAALMAITGRTSTTKAMGKGSTQFQHTVMTEVPPKLLEGWLERWAKHHGIAVETTAVGDRNVIEFIRKNGYSFGGENSGHLIFAEHATTGDGILSALQVLRMMRENALLSPHRRPQPAGRHRH